MKPDDDIAPDWNEAELSILRSAELDRPPARSVERTLAGLGVGAGVAVVASLGKAAALGHWVRGSLWLKWMGVALVGGGIAGSVLVLEKQRERGSATARASAITTRAPAPALELRAPVTAPPAIPSVASSASEARDANPQLAPSGRAPAPGRSASSEEAARNGEALNAEIRTIDEARQRLRRGDALGALQALERYSQTVGRGGSLRAEATVVRIEALQTSGDARGAAALGQRFLAKNPRSPYADYVRRILAHSK
jgi:hypothetical protein